ncbi:MAG: CPBP family intramembrane metalloprotease, partial [Chloroflexi bacterium]|nr:CPBP family intramembrane metalloprotease [Chloroflexota bacterium]
GLPWDNELISFFAGMFLLVGIPIILIRWVFKQPLSLYGLGLPPRHRWRLAVQTFLFVTLVSLPFFWFGSRIGAMRDLYPLYRSFDNTGQFILYELSYLPFFIAIEFIFRGYLLFGLAGVQDSEAHDTGISGPFYFGRYALLIQMLSYTAWHLGKPALELWGTLVWGLTAGATAYTIRSIWPIVLSHWLLNVFIDALIWQSL